MSVASPQNAIRRERAIRLTVAASVGAKAFSVACTFAQVPLAVHYLGAEAYGFWITIFSIVFVLNSVDFGLGVGMQHAMARSFGCDDMESVKRAFWTGAAVLSLLGLVVLAVGLPVARMSLWANVLQIRDGGLRADVARALMIALGSFVVGLPFNAVARLAAAVQRGWIHAGWIAAGSAISLALVAAAAREHWGFLWFLTASLLVPTIQGLGLFIHLLRRLRWGLNPTPLAPASEIRGMLQSSLYFAFPQFGLVLVQSAPAVAISVAEGSAAVTGYNLLIRLFSPFQQGQQLLLAPIWPAYTEAHEKSDHPWVERTFLRTVAAFFALAAAIAVVAWKSRALISIWIGPAADFGAARLSAIVAIWSLLQMAAQPSIFYLIGVGRLRRLAWAATPGLIFSALALFWGASGGTAESVLDAGSVAMAATLFPPLAWETLTAIRQNKSRGAPR